MARKTEGPVFVDTSAWVALAVTDDRHHGEATAIFQELLKRGMITTNLVVAETYVILRRAAGHRAAISFLEMVGASPRIKKVYSEPELEDEAEEILRRYSDQDFSFVDAVSFALMKRKGIEEAFAFDRHFLTMGFRTS